MIATYDLKYDEFSMALGYAMMSFGGETVATGAGNPAAKAVAPAKKAKKEKKEAAKKEEDDDDDFDVFGDDDDEEEDAGKPKETRAEMLERLKKEANDRLIAKAAKQRTMVAIEVKPWDTEQDLKQLWTKITTEIVQEGVKWGENCHLVEVAFGIKKICMSFVMGANNSSDEIIEQIEALEDEVQSVEMTSMNVL
ncbi:hypothetical protein TrST_g4770 [Triparma strigata]|uniref:Translation elongation factor EF1B beta/delta subunit guanine nucleotide exchange domain-containing protein n=1 Tax=Triparma strigata TaxID=1606541 RepID=A0A9W7EGX1_9STRA|nr:hypothetical protein TrST_g4770 [Triparma strigata]